LFWLLEKLAGNGSVLPRAGYFVFRQPIPKLIYFLLLKITFVAQKNYVALITEAD
jgi:hypothetical protein